MPGISGRAFPQARNLSAVDLKALAVQLMNALLVGEHLRQPHGDLKPSNLIISDHPGGGFFIQVQDWSLTLAHHSQSAETLWFRAPELHTGGFFTSQSALFTAAASMFFLATGAVPAQGKRAFTTSEWAFFCSAFCPTVCSTKHWIFLSCKSQATPPPRNKEAPSKIQCSNSNGENQSRWEFSRRGSYKKNKPEYRPDVEHRYRH